MRLAGKENKTTLHCLDGETEGQEEGTFPMPTKSVKSTARVRTQVWVSIYHTRKAYVFGLTRRVV